MSCINTVRGTRPAPRNTLNPNKAPGDTPVDCFAAEVLRMSTGMTTRRQRQPEFVNNNYHMNNRTKLSPFPPSAKQNPMRLLLQHKFLRVQTPQAFVQFSNRTTT